MYNIDADNWSRLPRYQYTRFAMTFINHHLTLVDGYGGGLEVTNQLAVYEHSSLPTLCSLLTSAIVDDYSYLVMNSKQVFRVSLPDIVSQTVDQSTTSKSPALWCHLPDTPLSCSAAISLHGYLLAVGGCHNNGT